MNTHRVCLYIPERVQTKLNLSEIMDLWEKYKPIHIEFDFEDSDYLTAEFTEKEVADKFELEVYDILSKTTT